MLALKQSFMFLGSQQIYLRCGTDMARAGAFIAEIQSISQGAG
jgi:hypothetical protein